MLFWTYGAVRPIWLLFFFFSVCGAQLCPTDFNDPSKVVYLTTENYEVRVSGPAVRLFARIANGTIYETEYAELILTTWSILDGNDPRTSNVVVPEQQMQSGPCLTSSRRFSQQDYSSPGRVVEVQRASIEYFFNNGSWLLWVDTYKSNLPLRLPRGDPEHPSGVNVTALASEVKFSFLLSNMTYASPSYWILTKQQVFLYGNLNISFPPQVITSLDPQRPYITQIITQEFFLGLVKMILSIEQFIFIDYQLYQANTITPGNNGRYFFGPGAFGGEYWSLWPAFDISIEWDPSLSVIFLDEVIYDPPTGAIAPDVASAPKLDDVLAAGSNSLPLILGASLGAVGAVIVVGAIVSISLWVQWNNRQSADAVGQLLLQMKDPSADVPKAETQYTSIGQTIPNSQAEMKNHSCDTGNIAKAAGDLNQIPSSQIKMLHKLGEGSQGSVFLANWNSRICAVKQLVANLDASILLKEAAIMSTLPQHRSIVGFFGVCIESGRYAIVSEFCPRGDLWSEIEKSSEEISPEVEYSSFKLMYGIAEGMEALSRHNVVHRDLACRNILLDERGFPKISDFGYSRRVDDDLKQGQTVASVGPVRWMSLENLRDKVYSEKSDVWAYGATLIEIFTRRPPYTSFHEPLPSLALSIGEDGNNPLSDPVAARCPESLKDLIQKCFQQNPQQRPSFSDLLVAFQARYPVLHAQYCLDLDDATAASELRSKKSSRANRHKNASQKPKYSSSKALESSNGCDLTKLEINALLGSGSFGEVYLGKLGGEFVAVKKIKQTGSAEAMSAMFREATIAASIPNHRNVIRMHGLKHDSGETLIVMEFASRGSLEDLLKHTTQLPEAAFYRLCLGIARGMAHLSKHNVVHRDLAARNILLDSNLEPKVADFGLSRMISDTEDSGKTQSSIGPLRWFAPECFQQTYSEKSDVWAFGCTIFEMAFKRVPFSKLDIFSIMKEVSRNSHNPLSDGFGANQLIVEFDPPDWVVALMEQCFKAKPEDRPTFRGIIDFLVDAAPKAVVSAERKLEKDRRAREAVISAIREIVV